MKSLAVISGIRKSICLELSKRLLEEGWIVCGRPWNKTLIDHPQFHQLSLEVIDEKKITI